MRQFVEMRRVLRSVGAGARAKKGKRGRRAMALPPGMGLPGR